MEGTVNEAIGPQETTIVENVISLLQQLLASQGPATEETPAIEAAMPMDEEEEMGAMKAMQDETGDTKAEDRLDNQTDVTDESMTDLKKNIDLLTRMLAKKQNVKKSITQDPVLAELKKLNSTLSVVIKAQQDQDQFNHSIMTAMGVSDDILTKTLQAPENKVQKSKPIQGQDMGLFVKELVSELFKNMPQNQQSIGDNHSFNTKYYDNAIQKDMCRLVDFACGANGRGNA